MIAWVGLFGLAVVTVAGRWSAPSPVSPTIPLCNPPPGGAIAFDVAALGTGRGLQSLLYGVGSLDATALSFALFALAIVALIACWLPAQRATRVDPIVALRSE